MDESARLTAKYEAMGEDEVRSNLAQGFISGRGIAPATEYLRKIDVKREAQQRAARADAQAEQSELARRAAASAEDAAVAARAQAEAAAEANTLARRAIEKAQTANTIATLAFIAALIAIIVFCHRWPCQLAACAVLAGYSAYAAEPRLLSFDRGVG